MRDFLRLLFSTDGGSPSWYRVMATPILAAAGFVFVFGAIKGDAGLCGIAAGVITGVLGLKAAQKKAEV